MIARIHHTKNGTEYVLQYNRKPDTIELRIIKHTFIGGIPNYFRHAFGTYVREMEAFKDILRNWRPLSGLSPHPDYLPQLSAEEKVLIHEFEQIANINLRLTPESVSRSHQNQAAMQGAANVLQASTESLRDAVSNLQGLDMNPLISYLNFRVDRQLVALAQWHEQNPPTAAEVENIRQRLGMPDDLQQELRIDRYEVGHIANIGSPAPMNEPPIPQEAPTLRNTEGLTEAQIQENQEFITRLLNGETISARENPPLPNPNSEDTSAPDPNTDDADIDDFLKEVDETLSDTTRDSDEVWGAPTHTPYLNADTMSKLWKQAQKPTSISPQSGAAPNQGSDDAG